MPNHTLQTHSTIIHMLRGIKQQLSLSNHPNVLKSNPRISPSNNEIQDEPVFVSYKPGIFKKLRDHFGVTNEMMVENLNDEYILCDKTTLHKGIIFFTSKFNFVVKTISKKEKNHLVRMNGEYSGYLMKNPDTLISKIFGCFKMKRKNESNLYFILINNILPHDRAINEVYNLKGSTYNRYSNNNSNVTLKDTDWINRERKLKLKGKRILLIKQIEADTLFLKKIKSMDYSLVVGIRNSREGFYKRRFFMVYRDKLGAAEEIENDEIQCNGRFNYNTTIFSREFGGYSADVISGSDNEVYFIGIIDILTYWSWVKIVENFIGKLLCKRNISCIDPKAYRARFLDMINKNVLCGS